MVTPSPVACAGVRNAFDGALNTLPGEVAEKVKKGGDTMPLDGAHLGASIIADARTTLHLQKVKDMIRGGCLASPSPQPHMTLPLQVAPMRPGW